MSLQMLNPHGRDAEVLDGRFFIPTRMNSSKRADPGVFVERPPVQPCLTPTPPR